MRSGYGYFAVFMVLVLAIVCGGCTDSVAGDDGVSEIELAATAKITELLAEEVAAGRLNKYEVVGTELGEAKEGMQPVTVTYTLLFGGKLDAFKAEVNCEMIFLTIPGS